MLVNKLKVQLQLIKRSTNRRFIIVFLENYYQKIGNYVGFWASRALTIRNLWTN